MMAFEEANNTAASEQSIFSENQDYTVFFLWHSQSVCTFKDLGSRSTWWQKTKAYTYTYIYTYIHIHTHTHNDKHKHTHETTTVTLTAQYTDNYCNPHCTVYR